MAGLREQNIMRQADVYELKQNKSVQVHELICIYVNKVPSRP